MRLKNNSKNGALFDLMVQHIITEVVLIVVIIIAYIGYEFIDNMFISRASEKEENMKQLKTSITEYSQKIQDYQNLWNDMLATGDDKRVISGLTFSKIEKIFNSLSNKFDISNIKLSLDILDPGPIIQDIKLNNIPKNVTLSAYRLIIEGSFEVETDVYNMLYFLSKNLSGVIIVESISIDSGFKPSDTDGMSYVKSLNVKIACSWFYLSTN